MAPLMPRSAPPGGDRLRALHDAGVSIWLDALSRRLLDEGSFLQLFRDRWVSGATTDPTTFATAIEDSESYAPQVRALVAYGRRDARELFFALALEDVRRAADALRPLFDATRGADGFVSFQCTPEFVDDAHGTIRQAMVLHERIDRPNAMIRVPGTTSSIGAVRFLTELGLNIDVTLLHQARRDVPYRRGGVRLRARAAPAGSPAGRLSRLIAQRPSRQAEAIASSAMSSRA
jgi:transaldolase